MNAKKKALLIISTIILLIVVTFIILFNPKNKNIDGKTRNFSSHEVVNIFNNFKKDCSPISSDGGKYKNNELNIEFDYDNNFTICERYPFNNKKAGLELDIWDNEDFNSSTPSSGPMARLYVNDAFSLAPDLMKLYNQEGFTDSGFSMGGNKIFRNKMRDVTCDKPDCEYTVYKFKDGGNVFLIKEDKNIGSTISSLRELRK
jgi:hypothetical protein